MSKINPNSPYSHYKRICNFVVVSTLSMNISIHYIVFYTLHSFAVETTHKLCILCPHLVYECDLLLAKELFVKGKIEPKSSKTLFML